jgi:hypothetical protein
MSTNGINAHVVSKAPSADPVTAGHRRITWLLSSAALRLLIAFVISWLILMAFFVTVVSSR